MDVPALGLPSAGLIKGEAGLASLRRIAEGAGKSAGPEAKNRALRKVGEQFEAVFIRLLLQQMRRTIPQSDFLDSAGNSEEIYGEIADAALADGLAQQRTLGIADMIVRQLGEKTAQTTPTQTFLAEEHRYSD